MVSLAKWLSVHLRTKWLWVRVLLQSLRPTHITYKIFDKKCAAIHEIKPRLILNKPIHVGLTVLELSKLLMCDFHYNFIKKNFDAEKNFDVIY